MIAEAWEAPAKINLWLSITGRRADGYHLVDTGLQAIDLADTVVLEPARGEEDLACRVEGEWAEDVPAGEENLAARAARRLAERAGVELRLSLRIVKAIPPGAGLGGGSSDAAAVLLALARRLALPEPEATLRELAAGLGADVPFFLEGGCRRARGIGGELTPLEPPAERWGILAHPGVAVSTAWAYRAWDESGAPPAEGAAAGDWRERGNAFEPLVYARWPEARRAADVLAGGPAAVTRLSGSGSAVYALYRDEAARDRDLGRVRAELGPATHHDRGARVWPFGIVGHGARPVPSVAGAEGGIFVRSTRAGG